MAEEGRPGQYGGAGLKKGLPRRRMTAPSPYCLMPHNAPIATFRLQSFQLQWKKSINQTSLKANP